MPTEEAYVKSAIQGIIIAVVFSFIILLIATRNWIQALISIFAVLFVVLSVLGIMNMIGWELG